MALKRKKKNKTTTIYILVRARACTINLDFLGISVTLHCNFVFSHLHSPQFSCTWGGREDCEEGKGSQGWRSDEGTGEVILLEGATV